MSPQLVQFRSEAQLEEIRNGSDWFNGLPATLQELIVEFFDHICSAGTRGANFEGTEFSTEGLRLLWMQVVSEQGEDSPLKIAYYRCFRSLAQMLGVQEDDAAYEQERLELDLALYYYRR